MNQSKLNLDEFNHKPLLKINKPFKFTNGHSIPEVTVSYKTFGSLNKKKTNAILICHALTGDQYAAGKHPFTNKKGWWDNMIGPNLVLDTNKYFLICSNVLGGCMGTSGPRSINPNTKKAYGMNFPDVTIKDMVSLQKELVDFLEIEKLFCVIGGSMGGMQVLEWGASYPERVLSLAPIATSFRHTAQNIAFHEVARQAIKTDPNWKEGNYIYNKTEPKHGLSAARMIAHITYMTENSFSSKFGRNRKDKSLTNIFDGSFEVEDYLQYQGSIFVKRFDANSYLYLTRSMDQFDLSEKYNKRLVKAFKNSSSRWLLVSFSSDWLFPTSESRLIVNALSANAVSVSFVEIESNRGHDSFLLNVPRFHSVLKGFLEGVENYSKI